VVQEESNKIYLVIFEYSYKFLRILEICSIFCELKQLKNDLKSQNSVGPKIGLRLQCTARWPATCARSEGWLGHSLAARSSCEGGPRAVRSLGALRRGHRALSAHGTVWWRVHRQPGGG
jgi:hypothetical protein